MHIRNTILITILILSALDIQAQKKDNPFSSANIKSISMRSGLWISLGLGPRFLNANPGTIKTFFIDDSPYATTFQSTIDVKDNYTQFALQPLMGFTHSFGLSHSIYGDITLAKNFVGFFGYSLGWDIPVNQNSNLIIIRPAANAMLGNVCFSLGKINNAFGYIQIDDNLYASDFLKLWLTQGSFVYGPQLDFTYMLNTNAGITLSVAYDFSQNINDPKVLFIPPSNENESNGDPRETSSVKLNDANLNIKYNGNEITRTPHEYGGFRITLTIVGISD